MDEKYLIIGIDAPNPVFRMEIMSIQFGTFLRTKKMLVFLVVVASIIATVIVLNFIPGEKKVQTR
ncbi:MAG: hypothetical protein ACYC1G_12385, partial [Thiobacillus sp.]